MPVARLHDRYLESVFLRRGFEPRPEVVGEAAADDQLVIRLLLDLADQDRRLAEMALRALADAEHARMEVDGATLGEHVAHVPAVEMQRGLAAAHVGDGDVQLRERLAQLAQDGDRGDRRA